VSQSDIVDLATPYRSFNAAKRNRAKSNFEGASGDTRHDAQSESAGSGTREAVRALWQATETLMGTSIYFIRCRDRVKIAVAANAHDRKRGD
jgi:hypothetical protein